MVADIDSINGKEVVNEIGESCIFVELDVSDSNNWKNAVDKTVQKFGKLDILVNNAGIPGPQASIKDMEEEDYLKVINIDLNGTFFGMQAAIPELIKASGASIVNISSLAGLEYSAPTPNVAYPAAKFGIRGLTKAAAMTIFG